MKRRLYLMRHGQTQMNEQNLNQGSWDSPLTEEGIAGAKRAGAYLKKAGLKFDHYYSSTSERACDTMELAAGSVPYIRLKGLKEYDFGAFEGKPQFLNPTPPFGDFFKKHGGESAEDVTNRMTEVLREIMDQPDHENVFVTSHGGIIGNFLISWLDHSSYQGPVFPIPNCTLFVVDYDNEKRSFDLIDIITPQNQQQFLDQ